MSQRKASRFVVVTPTLGRSKYLADTVESVAVQSEPILHILVCPESQLEELATRFPNAYVLAERGKQGLYAAVNQGLAAAGDWEWFSYINDDDLLAPGFSSVIRKHCASQENGIAYGDVRYIDSRGKSLGLVPVEADTRYLTSLFESGIPALTQQGTIVPRKWYDALDGFSSEYRLCADHDFWIRALLNHVPMRYYRVEVAAYRIVAGQLSANQEQMRSELRAIERRRFNRERGNPSLFIRMRFRVRNWRRYLERVIALGLVNSGDMFSGSSRRNSRIV